MLVTMVLYGKYYKLLGGGCYMWSGSRRRVLCISIIIAFALIAPNISPRVSETVQAAQAAKAPVASVSSKTLYLGNKDYQINIKNLASNAIVTYTSSNKKVATVSKKGVVKPVAPGKTTITITVKQNNKKYTLKVNITVKKPAYTPPEGSKKAVYQSGLDLNKKKGTYFTTTKEEYIETTRFILFLDKGVEVPLNCIDIINHIMDRIEDETGYQFYVPHYNNSDYMGMIGELDQYFASAEKFKKINKNHEKVEIVVADHDQTSEAYAVAGNGILIRPEHLKLVDDRAAEAIVHELLHVAWLRNGQSMGDPLSEGFAVYYTDIILDHDDMLPYTYDAYESLKGYENHITEQNAESMFINYTAGQSRYQFGFRLTCYMIEEYGKEAYKRLHAKVTKSYTGNGSMPMEIVAEAIKSELSKDFFPEFARWLSANRERFGDKDMSAYGDWYMEYGTLYKYFGNDKDVVIPDEVYWINPEAFMDNTSMETVQIPDHVTTIGGGAFYDCKNLKEIVIPDSVTTIGDNAFEGCSRLKKVVLPKGLTSIGKNVFMDCASLTDIALPKGLLSIDSNAFRGCTSLKSLKLPDTLTQIRLGAFAGCSSLESIVIPDGITAIPEDVFNGCAALKKVTLPKGVKKISTRTFWGCSSLKTINLPKGITVIEDAAFNFAGLTSVTIPDTVETIGDYAFGSNKNLKSIVIPKSVKSIGKDAFYGVDNLIIYGKKGSYAETYAEENNIKFKVN